MYAAAKVDVTNTIATRNQTLHSIVGDITTMAEMHIVKVPTQSRNGVNSSVRDLTALGKDQVAQAGGNVNDSLNGPVCQSRAGCQVENS